MHDFVLYCRTLYVCFNVVITLHTGHVQYFTEIVGKNLPTRITKFHIQFTSLCLSTVTSPLWVCILMINQTIFPDYDAAHIITAPGSVVIVALPLLQPLSLWEMLCSVNL